MLVVILLVAAVILGGIVVVAMGRGGELARDDVEMPAGPDLRTWSDVARYRPPPALLGYHAASTEWALMIIARSIAERDAEISWLRGRLAELQPESAGRGNDVTDATAVGAPARDDQGWARPAHGDQSADADQPVAGADRAWPADDQPAADAGQSVAGADRAWPADDQPAADAGQSVAGADRAWPADDQPAADAAQFAAGADWAWPSDDRVWPADDRATTAPAPEATHPEITPSPEGIAARGGMATPDSASEEPSAWQGASAQENVSAPEIGPEPKGSQSAAAAEPPVQAGYWPQAGTDGES